MKRGEQDLWAESVEVGVEGYNTVRMRSAAFTMGAIQSHLRIVREVTGNNWQKITPATYCFEIRPSKCQGHFHVHYTRGKPNIC